MQFEDYTQLLRKYRIPLGLVVVGLFLFITGLASTLGEKKQDEVKFETQEQITPAKSVSKPILIDIGGAVNEPGVYELPFESRIKDAIQKAGGFSTDADQEEISLKLNLASLLIDGQKIIIPAQGEELEISLPQSVAGEVSNELININTASKSKLKTLMGIGPVRADDIIANRPYGDKVELVTKKVIGQATFDKIKDEITVY